MGGCEVFFTPDVQFLRPTRPLAGRAADFSKSLCGFTLDAHWISFSRFQAVQVAFTLDSLGGSESTCPKRFDAGRSQRLPDPSLFVPKFSPALPQRCFKKQLSLPPKASKLLTSI